MSLLSLHSLLEGEEEEADEVLDDDAFCLTFLMMMYGARRSLRCSSKTSLVMTVHFATLLINAVLLSALIAFCSSI
jgi:hypothetical protein